MITHQHMHTQPTEPEFQLPGTDSPQHLLGCRGNGNACPAPALPQGLPAWKEESSEASNCCRMDWSRACARLASLHSSSNNRAAACTMCLPSSRLPAWANTVHTEGQGRHRHPPRCMLMMLQFQPLHRDTHTPVND